VQCVREVRLSPWMGVSAGWRQCSGRTLESTEGGGNRAGCGHWPNVGDDRRRWSGRRAERRRRRGGPRVPAGGVGQGGGGTGVGHGCRPGVGGGGSVCV
jgi:hypothetical protein